MTKSIIRIFLLVQFLCFLQSPLYGNGIKDGYWLGLKVLESQYTTRCSVEEWQFTEGEQFIRKSFRKNIEKSETYFSGRYDIQNDSISFSTLLEDKNYIITDDPNKNEKPITLLFEKTENYCLITNDKRSTKTYLFFFSETEPIDIKEYDTIIKDKLFSINIPSLFYNSNEVEFWEYASFYNDDAYPIYHHHYQSLKAGEMKFILFHDLQPLIVKSNSEDQIILHYVNDFDKELILTKEKIDILFDPLAINGKWNWKARNKIPDEENNIYTIYIGYPTHQMSIQNDTVKWFTQIYEDNLTPCNPDSIARLLNRFSYNQNNIKYYGESFTISPSQRLVLINTYNTFEIIQGKDNFYREEKMLRFISYKKNEFIFKELSIGNHSNGITTETNFSSEKNFIILNK